MDQNFDERLAKLENILSGIEDFMNGFKHTIQHKNLDDATVEREDERENTENTETTIGENMPNKHDFNNEIDTKTDDSSSKVNKDVSQEIKSMVTNVTDQSIETINVKLDKQSKNNVEIFDQIDTSLNNSQTNIEKLEYINAKDNATEKFSNENIDENLVSENKNDIEGTGRLENQSSDNKDTVAINYNDLNKRLISIEMLLKEISMSIQNLKPKGYYKNWEARHQVILSFCFVPKDVFTDILWKMSRQMENIYTGESSVNRLFDTLPTFVVSKTNRFPGNGVYININDYDIYNQCQKIREAAYYCGRYNNTSSGDVFKTALAYLHNLVLCEITDPKVRGMMSDLECFEQEYGLEWHED